MSSQLWETGQKYAPYSENNLKTNIISELNEVKNYTHNKRMQSDQTTRYARGLTADAWRYV